MQVKKYEAPTLQEALDTIKRELGPEAIILQTKQNRRGFGLMSKASVEVTAAVSERAADKKKTVEKRLPEAYTQKVNALPAKSQADIYESYLEKRIEREKVQLSSQNAANSAANNGNKKITAVRYADIQDDAATRAARQAEAAAAAAESEAPQVQTYTRNATASLPEYTVPANVESAIENYSQAKNESIEALQTEVSQLRRLVDELRRERKKPEYIDSDSPLAATEALQEAFEMLLQAGVERRFAVQIMREVGRQLTLEARADRDNVLDAVAEQLLRKSATRNLFGNSQGANGPDIHAFVGASGVGKTSSLAKLATDAVRNRNEKIGVIRIQLLGEETVDPLVVFSKALHIPYRQVTSIDELQVAIQDMSLCNRILIDTPAVSAKDPTSLGRVRTLLQSVPNVRVQAVLSAITRDLEQQEQSRALQTLNPETIIFTRLDESFSPGVVFSVSNRLQVPVSIFSKGKKVTEDWEAASPERITASILNIIC